VKLFNSRLRQRTQIKLAKFSSADDFDLLLFWPLCIPFISQLFVSRCSLHGQFMLALCEMDHKDAHTQTIDHYADVDEVQNQFSLKSLILLWSIVFVLKTQLNLRNSLDRL